MSSIANVSPGSFNPPAPRAGSAQARVDAAISRIDGLQARLTSLQQALATIQEAIALLQAELAALEAPDPSQYRRMETRREGTPPDDRTVTVEVFDRAAFGRAMSRYLAAVRRLENEIRAKEAELATKERELATCEQDLADAQQELADAQRDLEAALHDDAEALRRAQERYQEAQQRAQQARDQALLAQAQAQRAQEELQRASQAMQQLMEVARRSAERGDPMLAHAREQALQALQSGADYLPRLQGSELLPPATTISASDFVEMVPEIESFDTGGLALDPGLLAGVSAAATGGEVSDELLPQIVDAWRVAGFSTEEVESALVQMVQAEQIDAADMYEALGFIGELSILGTNPLFAQIAAGELPPISEGDSGASVDDVLGALDALDIIGPYGSNQTTGHYDHATEAAVQLFQEDYMQEAFPEQYQYLVENDLLGCVDSTTLLALDQALAEQAEESDTTAFAPSDTAGEIERVREPMDPEPRLAPPDMPRLLGHMPLEDAADFVYHSSYRSIMDGASARLMPFNTYAEYRQQAEQMAEEQQQRFLAMAGGSMSPGAAHRYNELAASQRVTDLSEMTEAQQHAYLRSVVTSQGGTFYTGEDQVNIIGIRGMHDGVTTENTPNVYNDTIYVAVMQRNPETNALEPHVYAFSATIEPGVNNANNVTFGYDVAAMPRYNYDGTFARDADGDLLPMDTGLPNDGRLGISAVADGYYPGAFTYGSSTSLPASDTGRVLWQQTSLMLYVDRFEGSPPVNDAHISQSEREEVWVGSGWGIAFHTTANETVVNGASAGCQVIPDQQEFNDFMALMAADSDNRTSLDYLVIDSLNLPIPPEPEPEPPPWGPQPF